MSKKLSGITDISGTYSQIYVTYDGGSTFSKIELPMELVKTKVKLISQIH